MENELNVILKDKLFVDKIEYHNNFIKKNLLFIEQNLVKKYRK